MLASLTSQATEKQNLPLSKVVLFNSGVGFYERVGSVDGDAEVELKFKTGEINDLLKSMVVMDLDGGNVSTVTYGSKDPIAKTLKTFAIDLTTRPTMAQLLDQVRGEQVELEAPDKIVGTIIGIERREQQIGKDQKITVEVLNLLTEGGLRSVILTDVARIRLVNEELDNELRQALIVLAQSHATDKKSVGLRLTGKGKRRVRVGYVQESPIWKTSYRLVLDDEKKPFLQGWAIVENTTDTDWRDVRLTLMSGRPISYIMDLYQPLYVPRPIVEPELFASLRPQTYDQDLARRAGEMKKLAQIRSGLENRDRKKELAVAADPFAPPRRPGEGSGRAVAKYVADKSKDQANWELNKGVRTVAQSGDVGELFEYVIQAPVTLARQRSAMLPIVNAEVKGEKVSIYNPGVHSKHPLNGLQLTNSTELHLMQGPITVFDGGSYAGDAKIEDLAPGAGRLISYALDLDTEVAVESRSQPDELVSVKIIKGTLHAKRKYERNAVYTAKNSSGKAKKVLIEYPVDANWKLVAPKKPAEKTRNLYRFAVDVKSGEAGKLDVKEERTATQQIAITNMNSSTIAYYIKARVVSDKVKAALQEIARRNHELQLVAAERQEAQRKIQSIEQDQNRIRQNMSRVPRETDLYRRYLKKFTEQEDQVETLREKVGECTEKEHQLRKARDEYLMKLSVE